MHTDVRIPLIRHREDHPQVLAPPPLLFLAPFLVGFALRRWLPVPGVPRWLRWAMGLLLLLTGASLAAWAFRTMDQANTSPNPLARTNALVTRGPFRYTRNPIYLSDALGYAGAALITNALGALLALPGVIAVVQRYVIMPEERYLMRRFILRYRWYKRRVPRWL